MLLLAVGTCFDAFLLAPVLAVLRSRGVPFRVAIAADARELADAREFCPSNASTLELPASGRDDAIVTFCRDLLLEQPSRVATFSRGAFQIALTDAAIANRVPSVSLDGVASLGLVEAAAAMLQPRPQRSHFVWLALEHAELLAKHERDAIAAELAASGMPVVTNTPLFARCGAVVTAPREQLEQALRARVVVTDSHGYQALAFVTATPCVALPGTLPSPGAVASGIATSAARIGDLHPAILRMAKVNAQATPSPGAAEPIVDAFLVGAPPSTTEVLPSDADASGRTFGSDEVALVSEVLRRGTLNSTKGTFVTTFEQRFAAWLGTKHAIACASGSAAVHCAIAALQLQPGDEVITTPITDMGALTPILYEGAVPVFADVEPVSLNVTAASIRAQLTDRTRAIVVTHLFGLPCDMTPILRLAEQRGIPVLEDGAQAFGATIGERKAGTLGALAAFSLQQGKHITTGEGGIVATDDDALARRVFLFVNKAWGYGDPKPDHYFPALNYRLTELQGAVAVAQLGKLDDVVARRRAVAQALRDALGGVRGLTLPQDPPHGTHSYWKFAFRVDPAVIPGGAPALGKRMQGSGVACVPRYIQKPAFECALFADWRKSPVTWLPLQHNPRRERAAAMFARADYPGAVKALDDVIVLPINERYLPAHVELVAGVIRAAVQELARG